MTNNLSVKLQLQNFMKIRLVKLIPITCCGTDVVIVTFRMHSDLKVTRQAMYVQRNNKAH
jgi:hypothetical protein